MSLEPTASLLRGTAATLSILIALGAQCPHLAEVTQLPGTGCHQPSGFLPCAPLLGGGQASPGAVTAMQVATQSSSVFALLGFAFAPGPVLDLGPFGITSACSVPPNQPCTFDLAPVVVAGSMGAAGQVPFNLALPADPLLCGAAIFGQALVLEATGPVASNVTRWRVGQPHTLLYDLTFASPPHTVDATVVAGTVPAPRDRPTSIAFGNPTVRTAVSSLTDQPLEFTGSTQNGDQIWLWLADLPIFRRYLFHTEVVLTGAWAASPAPGFRIFFDAPTIRSIDFYHDGSVRLWVPNVGTFAIANATFDTPILVEVAIDLWNDDLEVWIDGTQRHTGSFGQATALRDVRFSTTGASPTVRAAIDDVRIGGS